MIILILLPELFAMAFSLSSIKQIKGVDDWQRCLTSFWFSLLLSEADMRITMTEETSCRKLSCWLCSLASPWRLVNVRHLSNKSSPWPAGQNQQISTTPSIKRQCLLLPLQCLWKNTSCLRLLRREFMIWDLEAERPFPTLMKDTMGVETRHICWFLWL